MDRIDRIIDLLERLTVATEASIPPPKVPRSPRESDLPRAKKWVLAKVDELGPQTRGALSGRMAEGGRKFLDTALGELVAEGALTVRAPANRGGPIYARFGQEQEVIETDQPATVTKTAETNEELKKAALHVLLTISGAGQASLEYILSQNDHLNPELVTQAVERCVHYGLAVKRDAKYTITDKGKSAAAIT
jgi:hypothetical protein